MTVTITVIVVISIVPWSMGAARYVSIAPMKKHTSITTAILMKRINSHPFLFASLLGKEIALMFKYLPSKESKNTVMII
jgi:hypothetical protein